VVSVVSSALNGRHRLSADRHTPKLGSGLSPLVTTSTYDPTFNKPLAVTDPRGIVTTNT
jgi:hypothetical protein